MANHDSRSKSEWTAGATWGEVGELKSFDICRQDAGSARALVVGRIFTSEQDRDAIIAALNAKEQASSIAEFPEPVSVAVYLDWTLRAVGYTVGLRDQLNRIPMPFQIAVNVSELLTRQVAALQKLIDVLNKRQAEQSKAEEGAAE